LIRRAVVEDARDLAAVHIGTWQEAYKDDFPAEFLGSFDVEARARWFTNQIQSGAVILVAIEKSETVGFCWVGPSDDKAWAEIYAIYVDPNSWSSGVGFRLFAASIETLASLGYNHLMLWVLESNERARSFYERQGMTIARPFRLEEIGGVQVTEIRYELDLPARS